MSYERFNCMDGAQQANGSIGWFTPADTTTVQIPAGRLFADDSIAQLRKIVRRRDGGFVKLSEDGISFRIVDVTALKDAVDAYKSLTIESMGNPPSRSELDSAHQAVVDAMVLDEDEDEEEGAGEEFDSVHQTVVVEATAEEEEEEGAGEKEETTTTDAVQSTLPAAPARPKDGGLFVVVNAKNRCRVLTRADLAKSKLCGCVHRIGGFEKQCTL